MDSGEFMVIVAAVWRVCLVGFWWVLRCVVLFFELGTYRCTEPR